jgi:hypothetical protein
MVMDTYPYNNNIKYPFRLLRFSLPQKIFLANEDIQVIAVNEMHHITRKHCNRTNYKKHTLVYQGIHVCTL